MHFIFAMNFPLDLIQNHILLVCNFLQKKNKIYRYRVVFVSFMYHDVHILLKLFSKYFNFRLNCNNQRLQFKIFEILIFS